MKYSIKDIFNIPVKESLCVEGRPQSDNPFIPDVDSDYVFRKEILSDVLSWYMMGANDGLYLTGPTGSGKSSIILQTAARLNIPVLVVTGHSRLETPELVGHHVIVNNSMEYVYGPLALAMKEGYWFLLDEIDLLDPATAAGLNGIVEGRPLTIPEKGGEVIKPAPGFRFIATANTAGSGDRSGLYQGTLRQNGAFLDRFWMVEVDYPDEVQEKQILAKAMPSLADTVREALVSYANEIRKLFIKGEIEVTFSTRTLVRWAKLVYLFRPASAEGKNPIIHALDRALGYRAEPESREALHELAQRVFGG